MDDYSTDMYQMAGPLQQLFASINPFLVVTLGPEGIYGHVDHRSLSPTVSYLFNNSLDSKVLLHVVLSETRDEGYGFTQGKGSPTAGYDIIHRVADEAVNYQIDISNYSEYQKDSLSNYVSQYSLEEMAVIESFYDNATCPGKTLLPRCEQYILARTKPGFDHKSELGLLNFYATDWDGLVQPQAAPVVDGFSVTATSNAVTITGTASDPNNDLDQVFLDVGTQTIVCSGTSNFSCTVSGLTPGSYSYTGLTAQDILGNQSAILGPIAFNIDATPQCVTAQNTLHISAGRATSCGLVFLPSACAIGSSDNLGYTSGFYNLTSSVQEQSSGYWVKVSSCP